jgi:hypothetical protein
MEKTTMELMHDAYLRELIKGKSPYEKLAIIRRETGLTKGREVYKLRELDSAAINELSIAKQPEPSPARNPRMGGFTFRTVHS